MTITRELRTWNTGRLRPDHAAALDAIADRIDAEHKRLAQANELSNPQREAENAQMRAGVIRALDEADPPLIGEVGLDFGWRHAPSRLAQEAMLADIARWAARHGGRVMSLHSIRSARETLDILERAEALAACTCVFHWFSGPSDQLKRAIDAGCFFSCGTRMLATGKGREYVKAIPAERLLLETDAPPEQGTAYSYEEMRGELERVANAIAAIKGQSALETIARTSERLLGVIS